MPRIRRSEDEAQRAAEHGAEYLEVLARALSILSLFSDARRELTIADLAALSGSPRSSVRRVLLTLEHLGYAEQNGRAYRLTPRVLSLASAYLTSSGLAPVLQPVVDRISRELQESCSIAVLDGDEAVMIVRAIPPRIITVGIEVGFRLPAFSSSVGRVLLGSLSDPELDAYLARIEPRKITDHTVTDKAVLKAMIVTDHRQGFSIVDQEAEAGFRSIAVPVRRQGGAIACALHVGLQVERASIGRIHDEFLPVLRRAADEVAPLIV